MDGKERAFFPEDVPWELRSPETCLAAVHAGGAPLHSPAIPESAGTPEFYAKAGGGRAWLMDFMQGSGGNATEHEEEASAPEMRQPPIRQMQTERPRLRR